MQLMEIAQEEDADTCLGLCVFFERLHRLQQRFREEERTWEIMCGTMCVSAQFEVAIEQSWAYLN
jgi:hypothetical protein